MERNLERIQTEARAKMTWGETPENVFTFLRVEGLSEEEATEMLSDLILQRAADVRAAGRSKLFMGSGLIALPIVFYLICNGVGYVPFKLLMLTVAAGCYGIWQVIGGCMNLLAPSFGNEDLSD